MTPGAYIIAAKAVGSGMGLVHLAHPLQPPFTTYPPVIPIMLAPFANIAEEGFVGLKAEMIFFFWIVLMAFFLGFRKYLTDWRSFFALGVLGTGTLLAFAGRLQGEVPFTLFVVLTLCFADRFFKTAKVKDLVLALLFLALLCFSRQAGIAFAAGCVLAMIVMPLATLPTKKAMGASRDRNCRDHHRDCCSMGADDSRHPTRFPDPGELFHASGGRMGPKPGSDIHAVMVHAGTA